ncbi:MAG: ABC-F family ATP-binding cassette domain-containing protein [Simkaniaceae bacterium]|nr:ABC-F family ATP-binding cassette domain-containing protein [Simkaniaceae bacterium]
MQANELSLSYGTQVIFDKASFSLQSGEKCGLIGRNGSGKSTLFKLITGEEAADGGRIILPKGYQIGVLQQHIRFTKPTLLEETALGLREDEKDCLYKAEEMLFGLGFNKEAMEMSPHDLSGGYQLRVQLAKVLISEPDCLLLDEPTNYLDILSIRFLSRFLANWKGEMILISHDLQFLDATTTHMMGVIRQKVQKIKGKSTDLFELIASDELQYEATRQNLEKKKAHLQSFIDRFGAKASKATQAQSKQKMIDRLPILDELKAMHQLNFKFHELPFMGKKMLDARDLFFSYDKKKTLIEKCSLVIEKKDRIAIIGKNGYGKSTFLKLLTKELLPDKGEVDWAEATKIGYFGQTTIDRLDPKKCIEEEISSANTTMRFNEVRGICGLMMFSGDAAKKMIGVLSGGEKSRVLLGKIVAAPCNLLFLDEPTHHLDIESIEALIDAIEIFHGAVVMVTHSEWVLRRIPFNKLLVCHKEKQSLFLGNYEEFLEKEGWQEEDPVEKKKETLPPPPKKDNKKYETKILQIEGRLEKYHEKLASIAETGSPDEIRVLVSLIEKEEQELKHYYDQL